MIKPANDIKFKINKNFDLKFKVLILKLQFIVEQFNKREAYKIRK